MRWWPFRRRPTFAEAYAVALAEMEAAYPLKQQIADIKAHNEAADAAREEVSKRLDRDGEYKRGIEGLR
jgi:hypothetical protein